MNWHIYRITIFGHRFILRMDREAVSGDLESWFNDIVEALKSFGVKI
jgi:hypothetical protein